MAQDVSGGLPVRVTGPDGMSDDGLPLWGMQIDLEQARSELKAAVAGGGTAGTAAGHALCARAHCVYCDAVRALRGVCALFCMVCWRGQGGVFCCVAVFKIWAERSTARP